MIALKGKSHRLRERGTGVTPRRSGSVAARLRLNGGYHLEAEIGGALFGARNWCTFRCRLTLGLIVGLLIGRWWLLAIVPPPIVLWLGWSDIEYDDPVTAGPWHFSAARSLRLASSRV
jgi:hypothetical protein